MLGIRGTGRYRSALSGMLVGIGVVLTSLPAVVLPTPATAQSFPAFRQALAEGVAADPGLAAFYRQSEFAPVWTGADQAARRTALVSALAQAGDHGLPARRYDLPGLLSAFRAVESERDRGLAEARASLAFLQYARDLTSGVLEPGAIIEQIVRELPRPDVTELMHDFVAAEPVSFIRSLAPRAPEYARLLHAKRQLESQMAQGGWGAQVPSTGLRPGETGEAVVALRNRLIAMGYMPRVATARYDGAMQRAVQAFQIAHGIDPDGIAGRETLAAINTEPEQRRRAIIVALERERWMNIERGERHIWVNLTDFHARIVDHDLVTFETRAVVGAQQSDMQTPEFSHRMTYLELNPDWTLPRSIVARSYWNGLANGGHRYLQVVDARGRVVPREAIDFARYTPRNFPFEVRQPPGPSNPLGQVKFMFPNPYAIYLHDSPARQLFRTTVRTHSSGCVRLNDPEEFAYELLSRQTDDPVTLYQGTLRRGSLQRIYLDQPVPIHLVYRTAFTSADGEMQYRNDVYARDGRIYEALRAAGVEMQPAQS
ncbi:L,D-transpeptidase family protein [Pararhodobacter sp. SW119]|uniref:L,D-transpeptidase family protein n=1 Tax=Pararhodobacter sp. SW119 TaxID=2780075 RepID=UPI001FD86388|nr:L,D-transpeptidase family protein [Pararhodobacter sp. SW119]